MHDKSPSVAFIIVVHRTAFRRDIFHQVYSAARRAWDDDLAVFVRYSKLVIGGLKRPVVYRQIVFGLRVLQSDRRDIHILPGIRDKDFAFRIRNTAQLCIVIIGISTAYLIIFQAAFILESNMLKLVFQFGCYRVAFFGGDCCCVPFARICGRTDVQPLMSGGRPFQPSVPNGLRKSPAGLTERMDITAGLSVPRFGTSEPDVSIPRPAPTPNAPTRVRNPNNRRFARRLQEVSRCNPPLPCNNVFA